MTLVIPRHLRGAELALVIDGKAGTQMFTATRHTLLTSALVFLFTSTGWSQPLTTDQQPKPPDFRVQIWGSVMADFSLRVQNYFELRGRRSPSWTTTLVSSIMRSTAHYPKKKPLSTVPPNILAALPSLPDGIQYRFLGRHLVLHDTRANVIIDRIPYAVRCMGCDTPAR